MTLADEIDISRGDMIVKPNNQPQAEREFEAMVCWFSEHPQLGPAAKYVSCARPRAR